MKNNKKLVVLAGAAALGLVAATGVTTGFAWFAMNQQVTATGMSMTANSASAFLQINADGGYTDGPTVSNEEAAAKFANNVSVEGDGAAKWSVVSSNYAKLNLVTPTAIGQVMTWGVASSDAPDSAQGNKPTSSVTLVEATAENYKVKNNVVLGTKADGTGENYVLKQTLTFRNASADTDAANLRINGVTFTAGSNSIYKAVRILFVNASGEYALWSVRNNAFVTSAASPATAMTKYSGDVTADKDQPVVLSSLAHAGTITKLSVYMYFDGTDSDAYTNNATNLSAVSVSFSFKID